MGTPLTGEQPAWAEWTVAPRRGDFTLGIEEEVMLLSEEDWTLVQAIEEILPRFSPDLSPHVHAETHAAAVELATGVHETVAGATAELGMLRDVLHTTAEEMQVAVAGSGTHPTAVWSDMAVSPGARQALVYGSMRALARREPTFALHVHVGVPEPELATRVANRLRVHLPLLLALSANSPFWQGRDTGLASARTPLFQAFPRVGIPRPFSSYREWVDTVDLLLRAEALPEPTFLWWDVRMQPKLGTVEIRIMDAQTTRDSTASLVALVQSLARLEALEGWVPDEMIHAPELLDENRFLAARDGVGAALIDATRGCCVPLGEHLSSLLDACRPHAADLDCLDELDAVEELLKSPNSRAQVALVEADGVENLLSELVRAF